MSKILDFSTKHRQNIEKVEQYDAIICVGDEFNGNFLIIPAIEMISPIWQTNNGMSYKFTIKTSSPHHFTFDSAEEAIQERNKILKKIEGYYARAK